MNHANAYLAVARSDDMRRLLRMEPVARLAAHGMRVGRPTDQHPTSHVYGSGTSSLVGMRVRLPEDDPFLVACAEEFREGFLDFEIVVDVEFQFVRFHMLPMDRTKPTCTVEWSMREDRAEIEFDGDPTNHDIAAIADRAADMLSRIVDEKDARALQGRRHLEEAALKLNHIAHAVLGLDAEVHVMSNDAGSELIVMAFAESDDPEEPRNEVHFSPDLLLTLAGNPQFEFGMRPEWRMTMDMPDGGTAEWATSHSYDMSRRSVTCHAGHPIDMVEAMRCAAGYGDLDGRIAWVQERIRMDDAMEE